jgi:hypothetical protein
VSDETVKNSAFQFTILTFCGPMVVAATARSASSTFGTALDAGAALVDPRQARDR